MAEKKEVFGLTILTWNINGIRSFKKDTWKQTLDSLDADVICLQETKVTRDMIDEETALVDGYSAYFGFCRMRQGYSGVVTYCKDSVTPVRAEEGLTGLWTPADATEIIGNYDTSMNTDFTKQELKALDYEGRSVITQHEIMTGDNTTALVSIINLYCPRVDPEKPDRLEYKLNFFRLLELRVKALRDNGSRVIVVGDLNISHKIIDHCDPCSEEEFNKDMCKQWLTNFLTADKNRMVDCFRYFHPNKTEAFTCWNTKVSARATNYGTRIDYILADESIVDLANECELMKEIQGSDHCPVRAVLRVRPMSSNRCPYFCSKYFPEFSGKQVKLTDMFLKRKHTDISVPNKITKIEDCKNNVNSLQVPSKDTLSTKQIELKKQNSIKSYFQCKVDKVNVAGCNETHMKKKHPLQTDVKVNSNPNTIASGAWKSLLSGPKPPPPCKGHKELCVQRTVAKKGVNLNRKFWVCARGEGRANDPEARCNHFEWVPK